VFNITELARLVVTNSTSEQVTNSTSEQVTNSTSEQVTNSIVHTHIHTDNPVTKLSQKINNCDIRCALSTYIGGSINRHGNQDTGDIFIIDHEITGSIIVDGHGDFGKPISIGVCELVKTELINNKERLLNDLDARQFFIEICKLAEEHIKHIIIEESVKNGFKKISSEDEEEVGVKEYNGYIIKRYYTGTRWQNVRGGTTFTLVVIVRNLVYTVQLGDSDAYICTQEPILSEADNIEYIFDTIDSEETKPIDTNKTSILKISNCPSFEDRKEYDRIKSCNGLVQFDGLGTDIYETGTLGTGRSYKNVKNHWAICMSSPPDSIYNGGKLSMCRSLGDFNEKHFGASYMPVITCIDINKISRPSCIIIATDGVHDNWTETNIQKFLMDKSCLDALNNDPENGAFRVSESFKKRNIKYGTKHFGEDQDNATHSIIYLLPQ
jgi:serine/threonine protein phosphatase PrpC